MPTPSKGDRHRVSTRLPLPVAEALNKLRMNAGVSSESQFLADVLALVTGHSELVVELDQEILFDLGLDQEVLPLTA
ncbi:MULTISPECIES: hypothetical protein [Rhodococcus erythropolis group]|uniref:hypothetical protein n=1 Tax=Rhodococcus erythropolis group TaxID=2840174 RepID=UPI001C9B47AE|nr:hypothetical protein [Rhodococcus erythropolis]MBY6389191.1 hypothetical protein [Rhodococcus erythropolis]WCT06269.1 hypothetical protein PI247_31800 [Rhodococcus qingshengii]